MAPLNTTNLLKRLRNVMKDSKYVSQALQAYIIPSGDEHENEYIGPWDDRKRFITGFTGSRGFAVVSDNSAALWTDGRYFEQASKELDFNWTLMKEFVPGTPSKAKWLNEVLPFGSTVGGDPCTLSFDDWNTISSELQKFGHQLLPIETNLIDVIWDNRPDQKLQTIEDHPIEYAGKSWQRKVFEVREKMKDEDAFILVVTALDEIAYLFNLRGSDIAYNPVFYSYAIVTLDKVFLFTDADRLSSAAHEKLTADDACGFSVCAYESIRSSLQILIENSESGKIWINGAKSNHALVSLIPEEKRLLKITPIEVMKAIKNEVEVAAMKSAHIKDAVALCEYFSWLSRNVPDGNVTEMSAAEKLHEFRKLQEGYVGLSFETISSSGPNGAIIHYAPSFESDRTLSTEEPYLCDSGGQFKQGGTTDVTRVMHFGTPTQFQKKCFTLVLKGHINLSSAIFPKMLIGNALDALARLPLWEHGYTYLHGTGHGTGSYLCVHEGPMSIHYRPFPNDPGLQANMVLSIEPGCYISNEFGIRHENLALITEIKMENRPKNGIEFLTFEPLTLVPFQLSMIESSLMTQKEIDWLNKYHATCRDVVGRILEEEGKLDALKWLMEATVPLG